VNDPLVKFVTASNVDIQVHETPARCDICGESFTPRFLVQFQGTDCEDDYIGRFLCHVCLTRLRDEIFSTLTKALELSPRITGHGSRVTS
jgi:hypothetical protein